MSKYSKAILKALCELDISVDNLTVDNTVVVNAVNNLGIKLDTLATELQNQPQIESLNYITLCNNGEVTGYVAYSLNEKDGVITEYYKDENLVTVGVKPVGSVCKEESSEIFTTCKCDDGTIKYVEAYKREFIAGVLQSTLIGTFTDDTLVTPYVVTNPGECTGVESLAFKEVCKLDDVDGDGTNLVPYVQYVSLNADGTTTIIANYNSDFSGQYTPNNPVDPSSVGLPANGKSGLLILDSGSWSPSGLVKSFTYSVEGLATDTTQFTFTNGGTYTDSFGVITNIPDGHTATWSWEDVLSDAAPVITVGTKSIIINYTSY